MPRLWIWILSVVAVIAVGAWLLLSSAEEQSIVIAGGPSEGRYEEVASVLANHLQTKLGTRVTVVATSGSLANLRRLRSGEADLILYQHGTEDILRRHRPETLGSLPRELEGREPTFVANLYSEVTHFVVARNSLIDDIPDLMGKRVAVGQKDSGDYALSSLLLDHFGLPERNLVARHLTYDEIDQQFRAGQLDAALITAGLGAPIYHRLFKRGVDGEQTLCDLRSIPYIAALVAQQFPVDPFWIPAGYYRSQEPIEPPEDVRTLAFRAQLVASADLDEAVVEQITEIVLSESFQKAARLNELFSTGPSFARHKPEFPVHVGALHAYEPELKPLLPTEFVEATEGMRSFIVSMLIAGYLLVRWWKETRRRSAAHKLDSFIQRILQIERQQLNYDQHPGENDLSSLQQLLDEVTHLRQEALCEFSAHEIHEDRAISCFVSMCHALSEKINAKITRQRLDQLLRPLAKSGDPALRDD